MPKHFAEPPGLIPVTLRKACVEGGAFEQHEDQLGTEEIPGAQLTRLGNAAEFRLLLCGQPDSVAGIPEICLELLLPGN